MPICFSHAVVVRHKTEPPSILLPFPQSLFDSDHWETIRKYRGWLYF